MSKLLGLIFALVSLPVLFLNEGRAVRTARSLEEGAAVVVHVETSPVKKTNDGKLVHFTGMAVTASVVHDPMFNVEAKAFKLMRKVEMFQWKESYRHSAGSQQNGRHSPDAYDYEAVWLDRLQSSDHFMKKEGHQNPATMIYAAKTVAAGDVTVGDYQLPQHLVADLSGEFVPLTLDEKAVASVPGTAGKPPKLDRDSLYFGENPTAPQVGDIRVSFSMLGLSEISVIGRQRGNAVEPYPTKAGGTVEMGRVGTFDAYDMFDGAMKSNTVLTWAVRIGGYLLMFFGASMILRVRGLLRFVPVFGSAVNAGAGLLAFGLSSVASLTVIALAWIVYRPVLGLTLLAAGVVIGAFVLRGLRQRNGQVIP